MKKAILAVSFGTTHEHALTDSIESLEKEISISFPEYNVFRAFTSSIVMKKLSSKGIQVDNVSEALDRLIADGYDEVIVQPTHIINGIEYDKICMTCSMYRKKFRILKTGVPLLNSDNDMTAVCSFFAGNISENQALLFMGHGTEHSANILYTQFAEVCKKMSYNNIFTATVEGKPDIYDVIPIIKQSGYKEIIITPLMLVAGDHALNDMAGEDQDSWKNILSNEGFTALPLVKGLGEYQEIKKIYISHIKDIISSDSEYSHSP